MSDITIRRLIKADAGPVAELAGQLGYELTAAAVRRWVAATDETRVVLVAETDGAVIGWIEAHDLLLLQEPPVMEIGGLVVAEWSRGRGVGQQLVAAATEWGGERGHTRVIVRSNVTREGAHAFYEGLGFRHLKMSNTFAIETE